MRKILLIDFPNLAIRTLFADREMIDNPNPQFNLHKHLVINTIFMNIKKWQPNQVVLAIDDKMNWRKKVYSEYKANRKLARDASKFPWEKYFEYIEEYSKNIQETFPFITLKVPYTEADDIIAILSELHPNDKKIVISSDKDYIQLLRHKNLILFDPLKRKQIIDSNPLLTLEVKIISGDSGDNIPGIKSRVGEKTALKWITENKLETFLNESTELKSNYIRNKKLIDWSCIPDIVRSAIINKYEKELKKKVEPTTMSLMNFFIRQGLRKMMEDVSGIQHTLKQMTEESVLEEFI